MGSVKKKLAKGLKKITPKEIAPILPFVAMAIPGMQGISPFLRYALPQLLTAAASSRQTGDINLLNQALALGASYAAGPGTAGATNKELAFAADAPQAAMQPNAPMVTGQPPVGGIQPTVASSMQPTLAATDPAAFANLNATDFEAFKAANPGIKNTFMQNVNASLRPIGEGIQAIGSGDLFNLKGLMTVGSLGGTAAGTDYAKKKEIEFDEDEAQRMGYITDYADALAAFKNYFREQDYGLSDVYGTGNVPSFLAADGGRVKLQEGGLPQVSSLTEFNMPPIGNTFEQKNNPMSQIQNTVNQAIDNMQGNLNQNLQNSFKTETVDAIVPNDQQTTLASSRMMPVNRLPSGILGMLGGGNMNLQNFMAMRQQAMNRVRPQMGYAMGGEVAPGMPAGMQVDGRNGTFIPMGVQEKADDVPAMLSKNEFVMTADAVKGMGNGSAELGAQRMYDLMNNLEAKV
jgi:hypothetical protein